VPFSDPLSNMRLVSDNFIPLVTPEGLVSPMLKMSDDVRETESDWRDLPPLSGFVNAASLKPGVQVLLRHPLSRIRPS